MRRHIARWLYLNLPLSWVTSARSNEENFLGWLLMHAAYPEENSDA